MVLIFTFYVALPVTGMTLSYSILYYLNVLCSVIKKHFFGKYKTDQHHNLLFYCRLCFTLSNFTFTTDNSKLYRNVRTYYVPVIQQWMLAAN